MFLAKDVCFNLRGIRCLSNFPSAWTLYDGCARKGDIYDHLASLGFLILTVVRMNVFFSFLLPLLSLAPENSPAGILRDHTAISSALIMYPEHRFRTCSSRSLKYMFLDLNPSVLLMEVSFPLICQEAPLTAEELCCFFLFININVKCILYKI